MKLMYPLLAIGLMATPVIAQPIIIPLSPQKKDEPPPPPSPVPVAPPQTSSQGEPSATRQSEAPRDSAGGQVQSEPSGQDAAAARAQRQ